MFQGGLPPPSTTAGRVEHDDTSAIWSQVLQNMGYNPYSLQSEFYLSHERCDQEYLVYEQPFSFLVLHIRFGGYDLLDSRLHHCW